MSQPGWHSRDAREVAIRGVALGPVPGIVLGRTRTGGRLGRTRLALAVRTPQGDEWTPLLASPRQVVMTWERWRVVQHAVAQRHLASTRVRVTGSAQTAATTLRGVTAAA
jgi:hypothetical protein